MIKEKNGVNIGFESPPIVLDSKLNLLLLENQYQGFVSWWQENSHLFSTLSFNINNQTNQFIDDLENGVDFETAFLKIKSDLWGYYLEYIKQEAILPFTNRIKDGRLIGDFYGDKPIVDLVDEAEREGATKEAMEDLEEKLKIIQPGQFIFRLSPKGWTNLGYDYTETQFQVFWRQDNELIRGLTIRTGVDLDKIIELFRDLGVNFDSQLSEKDLLKEITKTNIVFKKGVSLAEIMEMIIEASCNLDHQKRKLREQYQQWRLNDGSYQRYDQLVDLLNFLEKKIKRMLSDNDLLTEEIESLLGFTLMIMAGKEREEKIMEGKFPIERESYSAYPDTRSPLYSSLYDKTFSYLQSLPGCAGGGFSSKDGLFQGPLGLFTVTPFGVSEVNQQESSDKLLKCVHCPFCHQTVDAEIIDHDGKNYIRCPKCGAEAVYK